jgi:hypothetical protein
VYVSSVGVFDEAVFPFNNMRANVGALFRRDILLLDQSLSNFEFGHEPVNDSNMENTHTTITISSHVLAVLQDTCSRIQAPGENLS